MAIEEPDVDQNLLKISKKEAATAVDFVELFIRGLGVKPPELSLGIRFNPGWRNRLSMDFLVRGLPDICLGDVKSRFAISEEIVNEFNVDKEPKNHFWEQRSLPREVAFLRNGELVIPGSFQCYYSTQEAMGVTLLKQVLNIPETMSVDGARISSFTIADLVAFGLLYEEVTEIPFGYNQQFNYQVCSTTRLGKLGEMATLSRNQHTGFWNITKRFHQERYEDVGGILVVEPAMNAGQG